jgi:DNA repair protein RadC
MHTDSALTALQNAGKPKVVRKKLAVKVTTTEIEHVIERLRYNSHIADIPFLQTVLVSANSKRDGQMIKSSKDSADLFMRYYSTLDMGIEQFCVAFLSRSNQIIGLLHLSTGGMHGTVVCTPRVAYPALCCGASAIVLCHNHPSGQLRPSEQDIRLTKNIKAALGFFDISVVDHIILGHGNNYYSFADEGQM